LKALRKSSGIDITYGNNIIHKGNKKSTPILFIPQSSYNVFMAITLHELLFEKYMDYQKASGQRKTMKQFSEFIGIGQVHMNRLMNERRKAGEKTIVHLADFYQDMRFYDAAGIERPEPLLTYTRRNWGKMPEDVKIRIAKEVAHYTTEPIPEDDGVETTKP
jgi:hypothetical protein